MALAAEMAIMDGTAMMADMPIMTLIALMAAMTLMISVLILLLLYCYNGSSSHNKVMVTLAAITTLFQ